MSGIEFFGGIFLLLGLFTRLSGGALAVVMLVAIKSAKWDQVDSLETLLGFDEFETLAKDSMIFPKFSTKVAKEAQEQTLRTITNLLVAGADVAETGEGRHEGGGSGQ